MGTFLSCVFSNTESDDPMGGLVELPAVALLGSPAGPKCRDQRFLGWENDLFQVSRKGFTTGQEAGLPL